MNTELLLKVRDRILAEPDSFGMYSFYGNRNCGTTACIAGHAVAEGRALSLDDAYDEIYLASYLIGDEARELLELTEMQGVRLFYVEDWPEPYQSDFVAAEGRANQARVAAAYILHFTQENK